MNMLNQLIVEGKVMEAAKVSTRDTYTVAVLNIAVECTFKQSDGTVLTETFFFEVKCYEPTLNKVRHLKPGQNIRVVGRLKQDRWVKKRKTYQKIYIVAEYIDVRKGEITE